MRRSADCHAPTLPLLAAHDSKSDSKPVGSQTVATLVQSDAWAARPAPDPRGGVTRLTKRALAELVGSFWLVFGGCGSAVPSAAFPTLGIGFLGVVLAFGPALLTMAYASGHISGCQINPAVSTGLAMEDASPRGNCLHM